MTRFEVDKACCQTPCLCGDIETWHPECYEGKTKVQIEKSTEQSYKIARCKLRKRADETVRLLCRMVCL
jgi:hypothetical protein